ncbi:MAG: hypothetical protein IKJ09_08380 [Bacteroidaceae bacterium]|nr:hypothetical protein [Bacteroidaceae bacterium]
MDCIYIIPKLSIHAPQGVPGHGGAVAFPIPIIVVCGVADEGIGGERYVALVVGLRAQYGIECPLLIAERGEGDAVEREAHDLGRGIELRLQPLELAHVAMPATPHAEGGKKEGMEYGAQLHKYSVWRKYSYLSPKTDGCLAFFISLA